MATYTDKQIVDELAEWLKRDRSWTPPTAGPSDDDEQADLFDVVEELVDNRHAAAIEAETATITSTTGVRFLARILRKGDTYGLDDCLTWDEDRAGVEFYDTRYDHTRFGQFVSRYYVDTILGRDGYGSSAGGLDLMGYEPSWKIDAAAMAVVRAWLTHEEG